MGKTRRETTTRHPRREAFGEKRGESREMVSTNANTSMRFRRNTSCASCPSRRGTGRWA